MQNIKFLALLLTKKEKEEQKHPTSKTPFLKLLKNCHQLHQLLIITNHFCHLWSDPDKKFLKNQCEVLTLVIVSSNKLYFHSLYERFKCTANKHRELNFFHKFYPFIQVWKCMDLVFDCSIGSPMLMLVSQIFELASRCLVYFNH